MGKEITIRSTNPTDPEIVDATIIDKSQALDPLRSSTIEFLGSVRVLRSGQCIEFVNVEYRGETSSRAVLGDVAVYGGGGGLRA